MTTGSEKQVNHLRNSFLRRLRNWIWGYDYFISYHWASGGAYAVGLAEALRSVRFEVFLDRSEFAAGDDWPQEAGWALQRTQRLVVVATRDAVLNSRPVAYEVERFAKLQRRIIEISFDDSLTDIDPQHNAVLGQIHSGSTIFIPEPVSCLETGPTKKTVRTLCQSYDILRRRLLRERIVALTVGILVAGVLAVIAMACAANLARRDAVGRLIQHYLTRGENHLQSSQLCESLPYFTEVLRHDSRRSDSNHLRLAAILRQIPNPIGFFPHTDGATYAELSNDGLLLLTADLAGRVTVWDVASARELAILFHHGPVRHASFNATASQVVTASADHTARIWDWKSNTAIELSHAMEVSRAWFTVDNKQVVTVSAGLLSPEGPGIFIWDAQTGRSVAEETISIPSAEGAELSPDGSKVAVWTRGVPTTLGYVCITVLDLSAKQSLQIEVKTVVGLSSCHFTPDSKWLLVTGNGQALLWNAETGAPGTLSLDQEPQAALRSEPLTFGADIPVDIVHAALSSDDPPVVALGHRDGSVRLLDSERKTRPIASQGWIRRLEFSPDNAYLQVTSSAFPGPTSQNHLSEALSRSTSASGNVRVYDVETTIPVSPPLRHAVGVSSSAFSADSSRIVVAGIDGIAAVWDLTSRSRNTATHRFILKDVINAEGYYQMHLNSKGDSVFGIAELASQEGNGNAFQVLRWNRSDEFNEAECVCILDARSNVNFIDESSIVAIDKFKIELLSLETGQCMWRIANPANDNQLAFVARHGDAVVLVKQGFAYIVDLVSGSCEKIDVGADAYCLDASRSAHSAAFIRENKVRMINLGNTEWHLAPFSVSPGVGIVKGGEFNQLGTRFLLFGHGSTALLTNTWNGAVFRLMHSNEIRSATFSGSGMKVLTTSADGTAQVWKAANGRPVGKSVRGGGIVTNGRFSSDEQRVVLVIADFGFRLAESETGDCLGPVVWQSQEIRDLIVDKEKVTMLQTDGSTWQVVDDLCNPGPQLNEAVLIGNALAGYQIDGQGITNSLNPDVRTALWKKWRDAPRE